MYCNMETVAVFPLIALALGIILYRVYRMFNRAPNTEIPRPINQVLSPDHFQSDFQRRQNASYSISAVHNAEPHVLPASRKRWNLCEVRVVAFTVIIASGLIKLNANYIGMLLCASFLSSWISKNLKKILRCMGFTEYGIVVDSMAHFLKKMTGTIRRDSYFSFLQSVGAVGLGWKRSILLFCYTFLSLVLLLVIISIYIE